MLGELRWGEGVKYFLTLYYMGDFTEPKQECTFFSVIGTSAITFLVKVKIFRYELPLDSMSKWQKITAGREGGEVQRSPHALEG